MIRQVYVILREKIDIGPLRDPTKYPLAGLCLKDTINSSSSIGLMKTESKPNDNYFVC